MCLTAIRFCEMGASAGNASVTSHHNFMPITHAVRKSNRRGETAFASHRVQPAVYCTHVPFAEECLHKIHNISAMPLPALHDGSHKEPPCRSHP